MGGSGPVGFDLDMTLINSRPAILASFAETSRETGTAIDLDAVDRRLGVKLDDELAFWFPPDRVAAAAEIYRRHYLRLAEPMTTVLPGAHEALAAVRAADSGQSSSRPSTRCRPGRACGPPGWPPTSCSPWYTARRRRRCCAA